MQTIRADLAIIGGGMAGVSAAMSAAAAGLTPLIVERRTSLGGLCTTGLVMPFMGIFGGGRKIIAGNFDRIVDRIRDAFPQSYSGYHYDPEAMRHTLDIITEQMGVRVLLDTYIHRVETREGRVTGVVGANKSGLVAIEAPFFIDATGDADVAAGAGAPFDMGRESDGKTQAYSLRFMMGGLQEKTACDYLENKANAAAFEGFLREAEQKAGVTILDAGFQHFRVPGRPGFLAFNCPRVTGVSAVDGQSLTDGYLLARKLQRVYLGILRDHVPGCEHAYIANTAESMGIRESRRIRGAYIITADDVAQGRRFDDGVCGNCWFIDIHNPDGRGLAHDIIYPRGGYNDIPYRALYAPQISNLLVAGRCISATHEALASVRIMPTCIATGQAAGEAAAMAVTAGVGAEAVDVAELRERLARAGTLITGLTL